MLYELVKLGHNAEKTTKNFRCVKGEGAVDQRTVVALGEYQASLAFHSSVRIITFTTSHLELCLMLLKYSKTFDSP